MSFHTISAKTVMALHALILKRFPGLAGVRAPEQIGASLQAAHGSFEGRELYPSPLDKIAKITVSLVQRHPFCDGNKRSGCLILLLLLELNGFTLQELPSTELEDLMVAIASGAVDEKQLCSLLKLKARPVP